ncbi:MAG: CcmE [Deltaproteobacteria bacterium]|nr:CcmE [Deltaproteobacteria bacterium]
MERAHVPDRVLAKLALAALTIAGSTVIFATTMRSETPYLWVGELADQLERWDGREVRVHGWVQPGSVRESVLGDDTRRAFVITQHDKSIRVFSRGVACGAMVDQTELVVTARVLRESELGTLALALGINARSEQPWVLDATELHLKCASKYAGVNPDPWPRAPLARFE